MVKFFLRNKLSSTVFALLLIFQFTLLFNSSFTVWPEMILYPYLNLNGFELYKDIVNPYFPALTVILSSYFYFFGLSILNLKFFTFLIILSTTITVFWASYKLSRSSLRAIFASLIYVLLSYSYGGNGLWFELAIAPVVTLAMVTLHLKRDKHTILLTGTLLALAFLVKQNAALFYLPAIFLLVWEKRYKLITFLFMPGLVLCIFTTLLVFNKEIFIDFFNWAVVLTLSYGSQPGFIYMPALRQYPIILFPLVSLISLFRFKIILSEKIYWVSIFIIALSFAFPRYEDFHLQILVCFSAIFASLLSRKEILVMLIIVLLVSTRSYQKLWMKQDRFLDTDTLALAEKIKHYESIYMLNSPDLVYFFADKVPPKPWGTNFPWYFENFNFEEKFIQGLDKTNTRYIIIGDRLGGNENALGNYVPENLVKYINEKYKIIERYKKYTIWQKI